MAIRHYMSKEIAEQPSVLRIASRWSQAPTPRIGWPTAKFWQPRTVHLMGCGSASNAARCGE